MIANRKNNRKYKRKIIKINNKKKAYVMCAEFVLFFEIINIFKPLNIYIYIIRLTH